MIGDLSTSVFSIVSSREFGDQNNKVTSIDFRKTDPNYLVMSGYFLDSSESRVYSFLISFDSTLFTEANESYLQG